MLGIAAPEPGFRGVGPLPRLFDLFKSFIQYDGSLHDALRKISENATVHSGLHSNGGRKT